MIDLTKLDPATTARHLRKPEGEIGRTLADSMSKRNWSVYEAGYKRLGVQAGERLFEVGFGNGKLAPRLLALARGVTYTGIDFSETMVGEAEAFNRGLIEAGRAAFRFASVEEIPFAAGSFDRALTVNTIYFWPEPVRALAEIRRVLRPGGLLLVSVGNPEQMQRDPFTRHGFRLYGQARLRELHESAGFHDAEVEVYRDTAPTLDRSGTIERECLFVVSAA
jgi:SAM-dependent methyltransferase